MNPAGTRPVLIPPRPNLGPEPLSQQLSTGQRVLIVLLVAVGALSLLALLRVLRRRRRRDRLRSSPLGLPAGPFLTRREQMATWSATVRDALAARFGPQWHARTTEEIAADAILSEAIGPDLAAQLVRFLSDADRAKFDDREGLQPPLPDFPPGWLVAFVASPPAPIPFSSPTIPSAGARSRIKGK